MATASSASHSGAPRTSYPSPAPNNLPFYQQTLAHDGGERETDDEEQGHGARREQEDNTNTQTTRQQPAVPDDPQLRANLASIMGGFGTYENGREDRHTPSIDGTPPHGGTDVFPQSSGPIDFTSHVPHKSKERSKVSRACDECRRKKIRCDAIDETSTAPCTNCARTAATCTYTRQPLKRGPSKGYIKELAERLKSLEQQVHPAQMDPARQYEIQQVQQAIAENLQATSREGRVEGHPRIGDKRSYATAEGLHNSVNPVPSAPMTPSSQRAPPPPHNTHTYRPAVGGAQPFWSRGGVDGRHDAFVQSYDSDNGTTITSFDWDETVIEEYYRIIHQTFPLLPSNKNRLRQRLADCPSSLREAFLVALDCLMRTFPTTTLPPNAGYAQALKRAAELLAKYPFDNPSTHTNATNLVYLQTLLLMALESDNHGPATIRGQAGPSRAEWLGRAAGVAGQLEINVIRTGSQSIMEGDRDSEERLARRVWWVLFILDRWHASSTADLLKLPENSVVLLPEDQILLGESTYHLARLSFIIGHLAAILTTTKTPSTDVMAPSNPASSLLGLTLAGEIDRFRESVESVWGSLNLVHVSYHHCHLLIKRLSPTTEPTELVGHAVKVATVLNSRLTPVTPLNHHFAALAAMTLCELCDVPKTRAEALKGLEHMVECLGEGRGLAGRQESEGWDGAIRELVVGKRMRLAQTLQQQSGQGLEGLVDAANGERESAGFDPTMLTRYGYLTALGQGRFMTK